MHYEAERGYLIVAGTSESVDYVKCAETLAKSLRYWHPDVKICLVTDAEYSNSLFDYIKPFPKGNTGGWTTDWQIFLASPFHETVKLEADMVVSGPVEHWWTLYRNTPVWISTGCRNYHGTESIKRTYRKIFDKNNLPDVYNALTYWRMSKEAKEFFQTVKHLFENWEQERTILEGAKDEHANTDLIYALSDDNFTTPNGPQIVHMKPSILGIQNEDWSKELVWEIVNGVLRINGHSQSGFVHYNQKHLAKSFGECYG